MAVKPVAVPRDVNLAASRLRGRLRRTPVTTSRTLDLLVGGTCLLKCENFQRTGSFKIRGALNKMLQLTAAQLAGGVVTYSSGNHAQAVALAARDLGTQATVLMPLGTASTKVSAVHEYGGSILFYDSKTVFGVDFARSLASERPLAIVHPFDDAAIIAGQGTAGLELLADEPELDIIVASTGGGSLLSGCALAVVAAKSKAMVYGVEPEGADDFRQSLRSGTIASIEPPSTIADSLRAHSPGQLTFQVAKQYVHDIVTVSDAEICGAMAFAFERLKYVLEPGGAAALAAVLYRKIVVAGKRVGIVLSGGNVTPETFAECLTLARTTPYPGLLG